MLRTFSTLSALLVTLSLSTTLHAGGPVPPAPVPSFPPTPVVAGNFATHLGTLRIEQTGDAARLTWATQLGTSRLDGVYQTIEMCNVRGQRESVTGFFGEFTFTNRDGEVTRRGAGIIMPTDDGSGNVVVRSQELADGEWRLPVEMRLAQAADPMPAQPQPVQPNPPADDDGELGFE